MNKMTIICADTQRMIKILKLCDRLSELSWDMIGSLNMTDDAKEDEKNKMEDKIDSIRRYVSDLLGSVVYENFRNSEETEI